MVLSIDLNEVPPESRPIEESATPTDLQHEHPTSHSGSGFVPSPIDADAIDDDVTFLTPTEWHADVWKQIRKKRSPRIAIDEIYETNAEHSGDAVEESMPIICLDCLNNASPMSRVTRGLVICPRDDIPKVKDEREPIPVSEKEAVVPEADESSSLICPVCMCAMNEPASTNCGHVFCEGCIVNAIKKHKKCPTCRKKLTMKNFHRIYLP